MSIEVHRFDEENDNVDHVMTIPKHAVVQRWAIR